MNGIQGCINAKVVRLYDSNKDSLEQFKSNLTDKQLSGAREHLRTVLGIRNKQKKILIMDLCSNKKCCKHEVCGRMRREYFGALREVLKQFNPNLNKCFIKRRSV